jgi:RNA polymerase sigma-70 factor (ECF subfamily)
MEAQALGAHATARDEAGRVMDQATFRALYEQTAPRLRAYLRRAARDAALADDLLQETFLKLLATRLPAAMLSSTPDAERQLRAYLYRVATNLLTDHWRRAQRERRWSLLNFFHARSSQQAEPQAAEFADNHLSLDTARAFGRLKPQEQSLLWLAYVEGFDHAEIAIALNVGERSVRVLLHRARQRLAEMLSQ